MMTIETRALIFLAELIISDEYLLTKQSNLPIRKRRNLFHRFPIQPSATDYYCTDH